MNPSARKPMIAENWKMYKISASSRPNDEPGDYS